MLTAVVLYYKNWPTIATTIERLLGELPAGAHVVVVDNASGDGAAAKLRVQFPKIDVMVRETNGGYAAGMNDGLRAAQAAGSIFALLMTHECLLESGAVDALLREIRSDDTIALAGPVLSTQEEPARVFSAGGTLNGKSFVPQHIWQGVADSEGAERASADVDWIDGACMMVRVSAVDGVGLLNEDFFLYVEEVELAVRLRQNDYRVVCVGQARASQSTSGIPPYYEARNQLMLTRMHGRRSALAGATARQVWCTAQDLRHGRLVGARRRVSGLIDFYCGKSGPQI